MQKAKTDGVVRDVKGQSYTEDLKNGDTVVAMAWSGDMVQAQIDKPSLRFALASEGGMLWTDNMMIPKGRPTRARPSCCQLLLRPRGLGGRLRPRRLHLAGQGRRTRS